MAPSGEHARIHREPAGTTSRPARVSTRPSGSPLLELRGISKAFGTVQALRDVSFSVAQGEVVALVGENGAGKSTLLRTLSGDHQPDRGALLVDGQHLRFSDPLESRRQGIRVVYQEPELVPTLTVAENIFLGELGGRIVRHRRLLRNARAVLDDLDFAGDVSVDATVETLAPGQRQLVEIAKAVHAGARVLALDEPTSALGEQEAARLFAIVRRLLGRGAGVIFVSHRLREALEIAQRVVILRDGELVAERASADLTEPEIIRLMVGRAIAEGFGDREGSPRAAAADQHRGLRVAELTTASVEDISFEVSAGEIVGIAGLVGAGRTEVARALYGLDPILRGEVWVDGRDVTPRSPRDALRAGIAFTPEDRKRDGVVAMRSVRENLTLSILGEMSDVRTMRRTRERTLVNRYVDDMAISAPSIEHAISTLSGGNQQKVVLARALARNPRVLILDDPTRGIDVGAKAEIHKLIHALAQEGMAVLVISSELPEVIRLSDRVLVMRSGRIVGEVARENATEVAIIELAVPDSKATLATSNGVR
ncbi:MAG: sugar ABC transporter ATP-binding protein [Gaiellales bacterium]